MAIQTVTADPVDAPSRRPPLPQNCIQQNDNAYVLRTFVVWLPPDVRAGDITDPSLWRLIQSGSYSLKKFDKIIAISNTHDFYAEGLITEATENAVVVQWGKLISTGKTRLNALFEDSVYSVVWDSRVGGKGYVIVEKASGKIVSPAYSSEPEAVAALKKLYPKAL
jgi:hypothetical protein